MAANTDTRLVNKMRNDSCTTALTVRTDKEMTDRVHADSPPNDETIISNRQTCRKIPGYIEIDTSNVIDDPKRGAKMDDHGKTEHRSGSSGISQISEITNFDDKQPDETSPREKGSVNTNTITGNGMSNDHSVLHLQLD